jgi:pimeloyl-ACP methyl ester carboxylesterase
MVPRSSSFTYRGHRLVYDVYEGEDEGGGGEGEGGQVLIYLHGLLIDSDINRGIAAALADRGHRVVLLDLLGHGRSDKPEHAAEYRIDAYADQVFALMDELGIEQAVLGGMSLGANVSLFAAGERPERVRGLVLEMPVLEWAVPSAAMLFVPLLLIAHYARGIARVASAVLRRVPDSPSDPLNSLLHAACASPDAIAAVLHGVLVGPVAPTQDERERIQAPALVLAHRNDLIHPFDDAENLSRELPHATLVRARSPVELRLRPDRLTDVIGDFLQTAWSDAPPREAGRRGRRPAADGVERDAG